MASQYKIYKLTEPVSLYYDNNLDPVLFNAGDLLVRVNQPGSIDRFVSPYNITNDKITWGGYHKFTIQVS